MEQKELNAKTIHNELDWLSEVIKLRFEIYFSEDKDLNSTNDIFDIEPPDLSHDNSSYSGFIKQYNFTYLERLIIVMSLAPHVRPNIYDPFRIINKQYNRPFTEFGGIVRGDHSAFLPTGETVAFVYSGADIYKRLELNDVFSVNHTFYLNDLLYLESSKDKEPLLSGLLNINTSFLDLVTIGEDTIPNFSSSFPAKVIDANIEYEDLVLDKLVVSSINQIVTWLNNEKYLNSDLPYKEKMLKGYKALFFGPPGTGKTITAGVIGKMVNRKVFKVDVSKISSKWVGETEKTLSKLFNKADKKEWILFFDEADAIFGKRSDVGSSNEMYANQTVSYLLQRIEDYTGMIILATNFKGNIDSAFIRRFQSIIQFKKPDSRLQKKLWDKTFKKVSLDDNIDFNSYTKKYNFTGASIKNIFNYCILRMLELKNDILNNRILEEAISYELRKEGRF